MGKCESCQAEVPDEHLVEKDGKKVCKNCAGASKEAGNEGGKAAAPSE